MNRFLEVFNVEFEKYQPYELYVGFSAKEDADVLTYGTCVNLLGHATRVITHFMTMTPPQSSEERYLAVWGVLQAFIIQQDAIRQLHQMFVAPVGKKGFKSEFRAWHELRSLRDATAGHPVGHSNPIMIVARDSNDWGVLVGFPVGGTPIHSYIRDRLPLYESELLEAFRLVTDGLQRRVDEVRAIDLEHERRLSGEQG